MIQAIANLNSSGNSQIYIKPDGLNDITISNNATGIVITITPVVGYNAANTQTANSAIVATLVALGFTVTFNSTTIVLTGSTLTVASIATYVFTIKNSANTTISNESLRLEIVTLNLASSQSSCEYCVAFTPSGNTINNLPISGRGKIEYYQVSTTESLLGSADYNAIFSKCFCEAANGVVVKGIFTVRAIPNCGGTSPIVFQIEKSITFNIVEYKPSATFETDDTCCLPIEKNIVITPLTIVANNNSPHGGCDQDLVLKYSIFDATNVEIPVLQIVAGAITTNDTSKVVTGVSTTFTSFPIGTKVYDLDDNFLGEIESITSDTTLAFKENSILDYTGNYKAEKYNILNPTTASIFSYTPIELGTYTIVAVLKNCCFTVTYKWTISICESYLVEVGTCNNAIIKNISAINFVKLTIKTYNGITLIDSVTQQNLFDNVLISPLSQLLIDGLQDGYYQVVTQELDENGEILSEKTQIIFYDCNIKKCQIKLTQDVLCFRKGDCLTNEKEYDEKNQDLMWFNNYRDILYSYWNKILPTQSIPVSWDIEEHLQELVKQSEAIYELSKICNSCVINPTHCFGTMSTSSYVYSNSNDCGCNK